MAFRLGPFGGARVIENLAPVMRELGFVIIFEDVNFGTVQKLFDEQGQLLNEEYIGRVDKFLNELIWMATRSSIRPRECCAGLNGIVERCQVRQSACEWRRS